MSQNTDQTDSSLHSPNSVAVRTIRRAKSRVQWAAKTLTSVTIPLLTDVELPWRQHRTPYRVFLAEFLLVRTRADVVAKHFEDIFSEFPNIRVLAEAEEEEIAKAVAPLGLHKRSKYLKRAAVYIVTENEGEIPNTLDELMDVPGLGAYSAPAIMAFAFDSHHVPADVNILRFLSRLTDLPMNHPTKGSEQLRDLLPYLSREENGPPTEYLLDFTRLICKSRKPRCELCPLQKRCVYFVLKTTEGDEK